MQWHLFNFSDSLAFGDTGARAFEAREPLIVTRQSRGC